MLINSIAQLFSASFIFLLEWVGLIKHFFFLFVIAYILPSAVGLFKMGELEFCKLRNHPYTVLLILNLRIAFFVAVNCSDSLQILFSLALKFPEKCQLVEITS